MKKLSTLAYLGIILAGCAQEIDISNEIPGAYSMSEQTIRQGDQVTTLKDLKQLKVYTGSHFMYTQLNPKDSLAAFGVGSYTIDGTSLTEHSMYSSAGGIVATDPQDYILDITIIPESYNQAPGYNQTINDIMIGGKSSVLIEFYRRSTDTITSPLDGVWRELRSFSVIDGDTVKNNRTQYKAFFRGNFMFGHTVVTPNDSLYTGMGYGIFRVTGENEIEETDLNSSYPFIAGNTFPLKFEMSDSDHFVQTVTNPDNTIGVEYYERVK